MKYNNPYIKVTWEDVPESFTPERVNRVKSYFQQKYNTKHIKVITKSLTQVENAKLKSLEVSDSILDPEYQKILMKDYIKENKIDIKWELLDRLDNKVNEELDKKNTTKVRYNKWFFKKVEFSNFLSYGDGNVIDYNELGGITAIESFPKNFGGKTILGVDLLLFLFFGNTTKTKTNGEIFNKFRDTNEVLVRGEIVIDGDDYIIERGLTRKLSKSDEYNITSKLEFFKKKEDGSLENLAGEQRRETEKFITSAIGSQEDFLATILTTGYNLEELIESKPTARGQVLMRFMGLESLRTKEEVAKEMYNEWSRKLIGNNYNITQLTLDNEGYSQGIETAERDIESIKGKLIDLVKNLKELEDRRDEILGSRNTDIDRDLINTNPDALQREIKIIEREKDDAIYRMNGIDVTEPKSFYLEEDHDKIKKEINSINTEILINENESRRLSLLIKGLKEGKVCPTCGTQLDQSDHTEEIKKIEQNIIDLSEKLPEINERLSSVSKNEENFKKLKESYEEYERNKLRKTKLELEVEQKKLQIDAKQLKIDRYESNKKKFEENQKIDTELTILRTKIETTNGDIRLSNASIEKNNTNIVLSKEKISTNLELIKKIRVEEEFGLIFKTYLGIYGKNGISKVIMKNMIPLLNQELQRLLSDSAHFILELNVNDKNEVEFIMIDTESRVIKPLNAGSGYERTISSLALRSVLTKISSLPKPNIVVMDEVFGKIADENLEMVGEFFKKIKNYFEHIVVISHNPLIRNWSDNLITVKKDDNVSSIDTITLKITENM